MYGGRSTTDPYASYPPGPSGDWSNPYPQGLPTQASPAGHARLADDVLDLAGYERREADVGLYDAYQPAPPTAPTMLRSQEARSQEVEDEQHGRLVMMDLAGAAPGPASAPDPAQVRILGGPPPRSQFSEGWAAPSGYVGTDGGLRSNGRVALIAACIAATIGVVAAVVISTVNAPGAARVEFGTSEPVELQTSAAVGGDVVVVPGDPAQAVASAPAATTAPIAARSVELAPVRRPGSTSVKPRVVGPTKATPTKASASPTPTKASPTPTPTSASPSPTQTTPTPTQTTPTPTPTEPSPEPPSSEPSPPSQPPTAEPVTPGG